MRLTGRPARLDRPTAIGIARRAVELGVTFIDTATNAIKHTTYVGRSPHEAFFTPDGKEVWVTVRGEDYVAVLDGASFQEKTRIKVAPGPGMQIFSPDGDFLGMWTGMGGPNDITRGKDGNYYIAEQEADGNPAYCTVRSPQGEVLAKMESRHVHGIGVDSEGNIYAGLTQNRGVDKFVRTG